MNEFKGFRKVFGFTFSQHVRSKGYRSATITLAVLCLLAPALIMAAVEAFGGGSEAEEYVPTVGKVYVVDDSSTDAVDLSFLNYVGGESFSDVEYLACSDFESAKTRADAAPDALILVISEDETGYLLNILLPDETELTENDAEGFRGFLYSYFSYVLVQKSGLDYTQIEELTTPTQTSVSTQDVVGPENGRSATDGVKEVISMLLPYLNVMALYFLVLIYGQSVSNSVIMEKTSHLVDTFLISVKPGAMVMGKLFAIVLAGTMQLMIWLAALVGGFAAGTFIVKAINPDTDMALIQLFEQLGLLSGMFTVSGVIFAVLMLLGGFLLYCSLGAIGGAMAGKPEDLSSTNIIFTLVLVISFLCTLYVSQGHITGTAAQVINWIPFTAVLITPSLILLGEISLAGAAGSLAVVAATSVLLTFVAGKIYKTMLMYKGNPPSIGKVIGMLKGQ